MPRRGWLHLLLLVLTGTTLFLSALPNWTNAETIGGALFQAGLFAFLVLAILGAHEMGHYIACRYHGLHASLPYFIPGIPFVALGTFGAVIRIRSRIPNRNVLFDVAIAGPIAGFVLALPCLYIGYFIAPAAPENPQGIEFARFGHPLVGLLVRRTIDDPTLILSNPFFGAGWIGMLFTALNLFPVGQLDAGHIAYAISRRLHRVTAYVTLAGLTFMIAWQIGVLKIAPAYVLWLLILAWLRDRHPPLAAPEYPLSPGRRRLAWVALLIFFLSFMPAPVIVPLAWLWGG